MIPIDPKRIPSLFRDAQTLAAAGKLADAERAFLTLLQARPDIPEIPFQLGQIAFRQGLFEKARGYLEQAAVLKPQETAILSALAEVLEKTGDTEHRGDVLNRWIKADPKAVKPLAEKAVLLQQTGDFTGAEATFRKAIRKAPYDGELFRLLLQSKKLKKGDPLIREMQDLYRHPRLNKASKSHLGFALAKAMEDTGDHGKVFRYLTPANKAMREEFPFDAAAREAEVDALISTFEGFDFPRPVEQQDTRIAPIFVTSMPRSGSTLVEQIIASHSKVTGGGELGFFLQEADKVLRDPNGALRHFRDIPTAEMAGLAERYEAKVRSVLAFDRVFTDKSIQTYQVLGLVRIALPEARIIVVDRDPRDMLLSIYKNVFMKGTHRYAYDLKDLARYYKTYRKMIEFWKRALPGGVFEINYDALIADPDGQTKSLVAAVGLDWEEACLQFHKNTRDVKTLSIHQVRQPIYTGSVKGWERYRDDLSELLDALEEDV